LKILLIDDHALFRRGSSFLLRSLDAALEVHEAGNCAKALEPRCRRQLRTCPARSQYAGRRGIDALAAMREALPDSPLVVLSGEENPGVVRAAIERGAMGFNSQVLDARSADPRPAACPRARRVSAADGTRRGQVRFLFQPRPGRTWIKPCCPVWTPRQMDILRFVIQGKPNKIIARELDISEGTVKSHLSSVLHALGTRNRTEAVYGRGEAGAAAGLETTA